MKMEPMKIPLVGADFTLVDAEDFDRLSPFKWYQQRSKGGEGRYAIRYKTSPEKGREVVFMHREINKTPDGMFTDHIDGDPLNNRRENLRSVTHSQNMKNRRLNKNSSTGIKGVYYDKDHGKFRAMIRSDGKVYRLGRFSSAEEAAAAYNAAAARLHGDFGRQNPTR